MAGGMGAFAGMQFGNVLLSWAMCLGVAARTWTQSQSRVYDLNGLVAWSRLGDGHVQV